MFCVIIYSAIDQGYMGPSLASCHKDEIWDLFGGISGLWSQEPSPKFGTSLRALLFVIWIFSFSRPNFLKPKPRLFSKTKFFRNRDFFQKPNFLKPKPRLFSKTKFFRNQNRNFFSETKFSETETETLKKLAKVLKPRSFETEMSISGQKVWLHSHRIIRINPCIPSSQVRIVWDQFIYIEGLVQPNKHVEAIHKPIFFIWWKWLRIWRLTKVWIPQRCLLSTFTCLLNLDELKGQFWDILL